jgi:hypothetical protein
MLDAMIEVHAGGLAADWARAAGFAVVADPGDADVVVQPPGVVSVAGVAGAQPRVLCAPHPAAALDFTEGTTYVTELADAYASDPRTLASAVRYAAAMPAREAGPLRLVWLGPCAAHFPDRPPIGQTAAIGSERVVIGRAPSAALVLRDGAHSDTCTIARHHAMVERVDGAIHVRDLGSTRGVWVRGVRTPAAILAPGDELALCGVFRIRLDGAP